MFVKRRIGKRCQVKYLSRKMNNNVGKNGVCLYWAPAAKRRYTLSRHQLDNGICKLQYILSNGHLHKVSFCNCLPLGLPLKLHSIAQAISCYKAVIKPVKNNLLNPLILWGNFLAFILWELQRQSENLAGLRLLEYLSM